MPRRKKVEEKDEPMVETSKGNVFIDLGFPKDEAINIVARLELMMQIENLIRKNGWTQKSWQASWTIAI